MVRQVTGSSEDCCAASVPPSCEAPFSEVAAAPSEEEEEAPSEEDAPSRVSSSEPFDTRSPTDTDSSLTTPATGAGTAYVIARHLLPNLLSVVLVNLSFSIPAAIFTEAFLSFIGMGVVPPTPSWGSLCNDGMHSLLWHPHELILPALFISVTVT